MSRRRHEAKIAWWQQQDNAALTERNEALKENRRLRDEVDTLRAALAAKDAENERLRAALEQIAFPPLRVTGFGDSETVDEYDPAGVAAAALDARAALADGEATG